MDWFKKKAETITIISLMFSGFLWINGKFNDLEKDVAIVKTVLMMKDVMPHALAKNSMEK